MWSLYFLGGLAAGSLITGLLLQLNKKRQQIKAESEQTIFQLVESSKDVIYHFEVKPELRFKYISPSLDRVMGPGTIQKSFKDAYAPFEKVHPDDYEDLCKKITGELDYNQILIQRWKDHTGAYRWFEEYVTPIYDSGELIAVQGIMRNIDEKVKLQQDLEYRLHHDILTDLYNRAYLESLFIKFDEQVNAPVGMIVCDLDNLKSINDHYGHKAGDVLIKAAAELLDQLSSPAVTVARIGGDEFILFVTGTTAAEMNKLANHLLEKINSHNNRQAQINIQLSVGTAFSPHSVGQIAELFSEADKNMYRNKGERKQPV
ncbi:hypothetical protein Bbad01_22450 [Bacillus badius]|nr:hypothetical protein Bbad01_22450 [Bacillus badius]